MLFKLDQMEKMTNTPRLTRIGQLLSRYVL